MKNLITKILVWIFAVIAFAFICVYGGLALLILISGIISVSEGDYHNAILAFVMVGITIAFILIEWLAKWIYE
jgi:hypothetical protein